MSIAEGSSRLEELRRSIREADPTAFLAESRVVRRLIRQRLGIATLSARVPHSQCQTAELQDLWEWIHPDELGVNSFAQLPQKCLLISLPEEGELEHWPIEELKQKLWRRLFHAQVDRCCSENEHLKQPSFVAAQIDQIGKIGFEEARSVLSGEMRIIDPESSGEVLRELIAHYLEFYYFEPDLLAVWFPSIAGRPLIQESIAQIVPADELFERTRLSGSADPDLTPASKRDEERLRQAQTGWSLGLGVTTSDRQYLWAMRRRDRAYERGNLVQSITMALRASQRATSIGKRKAAESRASEDVRNLVERLRAAISFPASDTAKWQAALWELAKNSVHGFWNSEKRLLYDLQKVCLSHERVTFKIDLVKWVVSRGKRPLRRPLDNLREVTMAKYLASAAGRLPYVRLSGADRERLNDLIRTTAELSDQQMRSRLRPALRESLQAVDLAPQSYPEQIGFDKLVEESLDCIAERGYLSMGYLRDAISRNDQKLPDLQDVRELWKGDRLLRADDRLDIALDGVYRRGEFYLRWIQIVSSLFFGTRAGRFATLYLIIPFGGSVLVIEGLRHILHLLEPHEVETVAVAGDEGEPNSDKEALESPVSKSSTDKAVDGADQDDTIAGEAQLTTTVTEPLVHHGVERQSEEQSEHSLPITLSGTQSLDIDIETVGFKADDDSRDTVILVEPTTADEAARQIVSQQTDSMTMVLALGFFLMALIHVRAFRGIVFEGMKTVWGWTKLVFVDVPLKLIKLQWVQKLWRDPLVIFLRRHVVVPLGIVLVTGKWLPTAFGAEPLTWGWVATTTLLFSLLWNSRLGRDAQELTVEWLGNAWHHLHARLVIALIDAIVDFFRMLLQNLERFIYAVDQWLRFRSNEHWTIVFFKAILGVIWSFVSFLLRIYVNLLIEPTFHPVKHFPVVTVAAKILLPALLMLESQMVNFLGQYIGTPLARSIAWINIFFLPGFFGFAVWELKENWRLFRSNRRWKLVAVPVGSHGESMRRLLCPGFHSGTLPKLFRRLRRLEQREASFGRFTHRRAAHELLRHVNHAIHNFVDRDFIHLLNESESWNGKALDCNWVQAAVNSVVIDIGFRDNGSDPLRLVIHERGGWVVAKVAHEGWLRYVPGDQRLAFENALVGFYRKSGVDFVEDQLQRFLTRGRPYEIREGELLVWDDAKYQSVEVFDLQHEDKFDKVGRDKVGSDTERASVQDDRRKACVKRESLESWYFGASDTHWADWEVCWGGPLGDRGNATSPRILNVGRAGVVPPPQRILPEITDELSASPTRHR